MVVHLQSFDTRTWSCLLDEMSRASTDKEVRDAQISNFKARNGDAVLALVPQMGSEFSSLLQSLRMGIAADPTSSLTPFCCKLRISNPPARNDIVCRNYGRCDFALTEQTFTTTKLISR